MLASILEPDIIFTNDCETRYVGKMAVGTLSWHADSHLPTSVCLWHRKDDDEMLYNVSMVSKRVKRRRVLSVNAATRELKRINPARVRVCPWCWTYLWSRIAAWHGCRTPPRLIR